MSSTIKIGPLVVTRQSAIVLATGLVSGGLLMAKGKYIVAVATSISLAVVAYNVNCMSVGKCEAYAWFMAIMYTISMLIAIPFINKKIK